MISFHLFFVYLIMPLQLHRLCSVEWWDNGLF